MTMPPLPKPDALRSALLATDLCNEFGINTLASDGWLSFNEEELNKLVKAYAAQEVAAERERLEKEVRAAIALLEANQQRAAIRTLVEALARPRP